MSRPRLDSPKFDRFFVVWFIFCAVLGLAILGFGAWAVYELVQWVTSK